MNKLLETALTAVKAASEKVLSIYHQDFSVHYKTDKSPLTQADEMAHQVIYQQLIQTGYAIVSEESTSDELQTNNNQSDHFWLVDPLDGTKEFIKKNDEFTINIALVENKRPILGVVAIPAKQTIYYAIAGQGAYKLVEGQRPESIGVSSVNDLTQSVIAVSRSHLKPEDKQFIDTYGIADTRPLGSAVKYCYIAEGQVDLSVRFTPLMQWDLAASDIIVNEAGGCVCDFNHQAYDYDINMADKPLTVGLIVTNGHLGVISAA